MLYLTGIFTATSIHAIRNISNVTSKDENHNDIQIIINKEYIFEAETKIVSDQ